MSRPFFFTHSTFLPSLRNPSFYCRCRSDTQKHHWSRLIDILPTVFRALSWGLSSRRSTLDVWIFLAAQWKLPPRCTWRYRDNERALRDMPSSKELRNNRVVSYRAVPRISLGNKEFRISGRTSGETNAKISRILHHTHVINLQIFCAARMRRIIPLTYNNRVLQIVHLFNFVRLFHES